MTSDLGAPPTHLLMQRHPRVHPHEHTQKTQVKKSYVPRLMRLTTGQISKLLSLTFLPQL